MDDRHGTGRRQRVLLASALISLLLGPATALAEPAADTASAEAAETAPDPFAALEELPPPDYADIETYPGYVAASEAAAEEITLGSVDAAGPESPQVAAEESRFRRAGDVTMDALVLRPFGALATTAGCAYMTVAAPFLLPTGEYGDALDTFVWDRARYTFDRPLGEF